MIQFPCPFCGRVVTAADNLETKQTACPGCHEAVPVPRLPSAVPPIPSLALPKESKWGNILGAVVGTLVLTISGAIAGLLPPTSNWSSWHPITGMIVGAVGGMCFALWTWYRFGRAVEPSNKDENPGMHTRSS